MEHGGLEPAQSRYVGTLESRDIDFGIVESCIGKNAQAITMDITPSCGYLSAREPVTVANSM